ILSRNIPGLTCRKPVSGKPDLSGLSEHARPMEGYPEFLLCTERGASCALGLLSRLRGNQKCKNPGNAWHGKPQCPFPFHGKHSAKEPRREPGAFSNQPASLARSAHRQCTLRPRKKSR